MAWQHLLASITGTLDQALLLRHAYRVTEHRILRQQITGRVRLSDGERKTLAEIGQKLGRPALAEVATIVNPATILAWHRTLVAKKGRVSDVHFTILHAMLRPSAEGSDMILIPVRCPRGHTDQAMKGGKTTVHLGNTTVAGMG